MPDQAPLTRILQTTVPSAAAAVAQDQAIDDAPFAATVSAVTFIPEATITGVATNNRTYQVVNKGADGTGTTVVAAVTMGNGVNAAAFDQRVIALSGTPANLAVAQGDVLVWNEVVNGGGLASPGGLVEVELTRT